MILTGGNRKMAPRQIRSAVSSLRHASAIRTILCPLLQNANLPTVAHFLANSISRPPVWRQIPFVNLPPSHKETSRWFAEYVLPHERSLRYYLHKSLPSNSDAEDAMQDTYSKLLQAKGREIIQSPKKLLFAIARNVVRDFIRQRARVTIEPIAENTRMPVLNEKAGVVESICREQEIALLNEAIDALPERCREVIILRKIQGLSQKEIAHELGITEHTVEALAVKGVHRIASYLRSKGMREGGPR
jgi:RNA polymerase sigma factor (sigma-70 family)